MRRTLATVTVALAVVLAGCAGGIAPGDGAGDGEETGTVQFYVSDERNAIDQFEHLNVTISSVGFRAADGEGNESDDGGENGTWVTRDANATTVDLTELQGANATLLDAYDVPADDYTTVFAHVSEVDGTLTTGEQVAVKLPSEKLQLHTPVSVGPNTTTDYVFDITVFEAGKSGKFILKPVVSESGTDVPIEERGREDDEEDAEGDGLQASIDGSLAPNETVTVTVRDADGPVANATVAVNGEPAGATDANGTVAVSVPDAEELSVVVTSGDASTEFERSIDRATATETTG
jgi:hypothetical protein